jgi:SAM-dependent methyltransferase
VRPRIYGDRLACFRRTADVAFWDEHWREGLTRERYEGFDAGQLGCFEGAFTRNLPRTGRILEAGCGIGQYVVALRARGYDAEGVEWAPETVAKVRTMRPDLPIRQGDVTALGVPDGYYKGYVSLGVMEHRREGPEPFLREAYRVLTSDGIALISVPFAHRLRQLKRAVGCYRGRSDGEFYQFVFDKREFRGCLEDAGFTVVEQVPYDAVKGLSDEVAALRWWFLRTAAGRRTAQELQVTGRLDRWFGHMILFVCRKRET